MIEYNKEILAYYEEVFGKEKTRKIIAAFSEERFRAIRANTLKVTPSALKTRLEKKGFELKPAWTRESFFVTREPFSISASTEHLLGLFFIQDPASMLPPVELSPKPGELVLDACAAPGGKLTHIAQWMRNMGTVIALDLNFSKIKAAKSNLERMGIKNTLLYMWDSNKVSDFGLVFDRVLVDAPCSCDGTINKNPGRAKTLCLADYAKYSEMQKSLLENVFPVLKKGGRLVYSTCSLSPEENEKVVLFAKEIGYKLLPAKFKIGEGGMFGLAGARRIMPSREGGGFFYAVMRR